MNDPTAAARSRAQHAVTNYRHTTILSYDHWHLRIHLDQAYLGRSVLWRRKRGNAISPTVLSPRERDEAHYIMVQWEKAVMELWAPARFNHAWLANLTHEHGGHGHWHLIPRYEESRRWRGVCYVDERYGQNYVPYKPRLVDPKILRQLRDDIRGEIDALGV